MIKNNLIIKTIILILMPIMFIFGFYVQFNGEYSPGGGFQAGVLISTAIILFSMFFDRKIVLQIFPIYRLKLFSGIGVMIYFMTGFVSMLMGGNFFSYGFLLKNFSYAQKFGITLIELGVGLTVFSVTTLIYFISSE